MQPHLLATEGTWLGPALLCSAVGSPPREPYDLGTRSSMHEVLFLMFGIESNMLSD